VHLNGFSLYLTALCNLIQGDFQTHSLQERLLQALNTIISYIFLYIAICVIYDKFANKSNNKGDEET